MQPDLLLLLQLNRLALLLNEFLLLSLDELKFVLLSFLSVFDSFVLQRSHTVNLRPELVFVCGDFGLDLGDLVLDDLLFVHASEVGRC